MTLMKISACGSACILTVLWAVGAAGLTLFFLLGYFAHAAGAFRCKTSAGRRHLALFLRGSGFIERSPFVYWMMRAPADLRLGRPVVVLPSIWKQMRGGECTFTHELVHIRSLDCLRKWLLTSALCVHWFNPLVWLMVYTANRNLELACDGTVLRLLEMAAGKLTLACCWNLRRGSGRIWRLAAALARLLPRKGSIIL